jgi:PAS domain S-box-containing protein
MDRDETDFGASYWRSAPARPDPVVPLPAGALPPEELRQLADNVPTLCWIANADGYIVWYSRRWYEYTGTTPAEMEGWGWQSVHDPDQLPGAMARWTASIATGEPFEMTFPLRGADGVFRPFLTRVQNVRGPGGEIVRWYGVNTDVSAQVEAEAALRERESMFRGIFESRLAGMAIVDLASGEVLAVNDALLEITGQPREIFFEHEAWWRITPAEYHHLDRAAIEQILETGAAEPFDKEYLRPDGSRVPVRVAAAVVPGKPHQIVVHVSDISARRRAEAHQRLLVDELNHRVKNTLAIVQGIAQQIFKGEADGPAAREAFEGRLAALSAAHNVLTERKWERASVREVVNSTIAPYSGQPAPFSIDGPDVDLSPKTAVALALSLHELCTNAAKYGGLSVPGGRVELAWACDEERLRLRWRELGGPPVLAPARRGFGTRMLERGLAAELGGKVTIAFDADGVVCTLDAPLPPQPT